jgi:hypothetical protein
VGDEVVLVHLKTNQIYALNETGARFWELLAEETSRDEIVATLTAEFTVSTDQLEREITALVGELERAGMVEQVTA